MERAQNHQEAYQRGYADGSRMAEQMRWKGTPIGFLFKGSCYDPDGEFHAAYDDGFKQAMNAASRIEWTLPKDTAPSSRHGSVTGSKSWLSAA
jgi:hypothetical protein